MRQAGFLRPLFPSLTICLLLWNTAAIGQQVTAPVPGAPVTLQNAPQRDTSNKTNTSTWRDEDAQIRYTKINSQVTYFPDTSLHTFHRRPFSQPWHRDLGNLGSPSRSLFFKPEDRTGPTLGYRVSDVYRYDPDSLSYYNTTRPYSQFIYNLGSKAEQLAGVLHTQNITPRWNFAVNYRKIGAPGYYRIQRTSHDLGSLSTNYQSSNQHYKLYGSVVYNKLQHDENGGIIADSLLANESFGDRRTIPVLFQNDAYSTRRSAVTNVLRDFSISLRHDYTWGRTDTLYNEDSTRYSFKLVPRFSIGHRLRIHSEKHQYKDLRPDSLRYTAFFQEAFTGATDSVFSQQKWVYADNAFMLNGFIGADERQLLFSAGFGTRFDQFNTEFVVNNEGTDFVSNYLTGEVKKEALQEGQWFYNAHAKLFLTGNTAGNFLLHGDVGKDLGNTVGNLAVGFEQRLNDAPYNHTIYRNRYYEQRQSFNNETVTLLYGSYNNNRWNVSAGINNYLISNYYYLSQDQAFSQHADPFNITQLWLKKVFRLGIWVLDNELAYQQKAGTAPVNVPALMGRHQLSIETWLFGNALKIATGIDLRWHGPYAPAGYAPFFNRFYYQDSYNASNLPEAAIFFNFRIKKFRCFVMGDQLQQLARKGNVISAPGYPLQDPMIRFGFNWVMVN